MKYSAAAAIAIMYLTCCGGGQRTKEMTNAALNTEVAPLSADLVPVISNSAISMIVGSVRSLRSTTQEQGGLPVEAGQVFFYVEEVIHSPTLQRGETIETPFKRIADRLRVKNSMDQWNVLPLRQNDLVLLACSSAGDPRACIGRAARSLNGFRDPVLSAVRRCYAIEKMPNTPAKREQLEMALGAKQEPLPFYALDALGRRSLFGRDVGAETVEHAIASPSVAPEDKLELGNYLTRSYFFDASHNADTANGKVLSALATGLVNEQDTERRLEWAHHLKSCVFNFSDEEPEHFTTRAQLIRSVRTPPPQQVIAALTELLKNSQDEDEKSDLADLIAAWRAAS